MQIVCYGQELSGLLSRVHQTGSSGLTHAIFYVNYFEFTDFYQLHIGNKTRSEEMGPPLQTFRSMELCPMLLI